MFCLLPSSGLLMDIHKAGTNDHAAFSTRNHGEDAERLAMRVARCIFNLVSFTIIRRCLPTVLATRGIYDERAFSECPSWPMRWRVQNDQSTLLDHCRPRRTPEVVTFSIIVGKVRLRYEWVNLYGGAMSWQAKMIDGVVDRLAATLKEDGYQKQRTWHRVMENRSICLTCRRDQTVLLSTGVFYPQVRGWQDKHRCWTCPRIRLHCSRKNRTSNACKTDKWWRFDSGRPERNGERCGRVVKYGEPWMSGVQFGTGTH